MSTGDEDQAWRAIVENYGDRALLDEDLHESAELDPHHPRTDGAVTRHSLESGSSSTDDASGPSDAFPAEVSAAQGFPAAGHGPTDDVSADGADIVTPETRFIAPDPPLPALGARRWFAWACVLGSPVAFIVLALFGASAGGLTAFVLTLTFVGGFAWLVAMMPQEPRDPWDDGSRV